jgi:FixJ family two-component response regulator
VRPELGANLAQFTAFTRQRADRWRGSPPGARLTSGWNGRLGHALALMDKKAPMISIIDDDAFVRVATDGLVRSLGYRTTTFASAEDYLQSDRINDTSCVITDVQMPGLSGVELQSLLVARGNCTPMIFITAFPEEKVRRRALEAGAIGFLSKPFDDEQLIEHLQTALRSHNAAGSAE